MKRTPALFFLATTCLLLSACGEQEAQANPSRAALLKNPLYAERYWDNMVDLLVELAIQNDPILAEKQSVLDKWREEGLKEAQDATGTQRGGTIGPFIPVKANVRGEALYLGDTVYLGPEFETVGGPSLHLYLTTIADPREGTFPDETSIDLGELATPYSAQQYLVGEVENPVQYRTVVLWDTRLGLLYGFAQLAK
ncbi:MAG: hypothetical protein Q7R81_04860 [Candidatus Peregrinibacteria bacterium]|nr:hypothetical protein [Candidatus Peregrinibacteria bacterium]